MVSGVSRKGGLGLIADFVRRNPRASAIAAFNLGLYAATLARKNVRASELKELPGKLVELVPSMRDLIPGFGDEPPARRRRKPRPRRRAAARRTAKRQAA